jgi:hypothetical protein
MMTPNSSSRSAMAETGAAHVLRIADFTETPGARYYTDGPASGEEFREEWLIPAFKKALAESVHLIVDLDGAYGYATSFLEESFGELADRYGSDVVFKNIEIRTFDEPSLEAEVFEYILQGNKRGASKK